MKKNSALKQLIAQTPDQGINQIVCHPAVHVLVTPVSYAQLNGKDPSVIDALLEKGKDATFRNTHGHTVLYMACYGPSPLETLISLVEKGKVDVNAPIARNRTCLMFFASMRFVDSCVYLLKVCKMDPNRQDVDGNTALPYCIHGEMPTREATPFTFVNPDSLLIETFGVLIKYGAYPSLKNIEGLDAMDVPANSGKYKVLKNWFPDDLIKDRDEKYMKQATGRVRSTLFAVKPH